MGQTSSIDTIQERFSENLVTPRMAQLFGQTPLRFLERVLWLMMLLWVVTQAAHLVQKDFCTVL